RPRQPQGRAVRRLAGGPARHVRQGPVPRPRDVHDLRADGHHPRAAAHGTLRRAMTRGLALVAAVLLIALPWGLSSYQLGLLTKMLIFAVFAMSLNLILGYAGLPSLGHAAYFGVAFVLAGTLAGLSGALFVYYNGFVSPAYLSIVFSAMALIMVILGGAGTLLGPAVGSAAIVFLENAISAYTERWLLILGLIYVV